MLVELDEEGCLIQQCQEWPPPVRQCLRSLQGHPQQELLEQQMQLFSKQAVLLRVGH
jgi:hypothetical protein